MQRVAEKLRAEEPDPERVPVVVIRANQEDVGASARLVIALCRKTHVLFAFNADRKLVAGLLQDRE